MRESTGLRAARRRVRAAGSLARPRRATAHTILCLTPRRMPTNPLRPLLQGYELAAANSWSAALKLARRTPYDLYVIYTPLGWGEPIEICQRIRTFDPYTPVIVFAVRPDAAERREVLTSGCVQAYVARTEDANNLSGTAGQLIMLSELNSMDALKRGVQAIEEHIVQELAGRSGATPAAGSRTATRLKVEACRIFGAVGGSRANFERLWPAIYDSAVKRVPKPRA